MVVVVGFFWCFLCKTQRKFMTKKMLIFIGQTPMILLMEEILHHQGCIKPCK